ncbi:ArdC family protein [Pseudochrobactrum kiredjianiae]|uniref:ArdC family protein n=1 Tax=Pseudochrobactrum kiredjianiae TaxID=386305 RepID=A0ABW3UY69_9HYPH|nr:ArdC family protein [Pseudochrobactrum kiredjianiae]MDM7852512.1 ArdC family protein [Pseudochrobactrum kiredjianiae]
MTKTIISHKDIYQDVTNAIIAQLETGVASWVKPWIGGASMSLPKRATGEYYKDINILLLWTAAHEFDFSSPYWMTFKQAKALGAQVRKGSKSTTIVYANVFTREKQDAEGKDVERTSHF